MEAEHHLAVEDAIRQEIGNKKNVDGKYKYMLQEISVKFVEKLPLFPLTRSGDIDKSFQYPGIYLIYYVGAKSLYKGLVSSSKDQPIYVGMSRVSAFTRLNIHRGRLEKAKDLQVQDFKVRFMSLDIEHYAPCIEGMLIEYYSPLWNDTAVKLSFGNASDESNNWYKYHVDEDDKTINNIIENVESFQLSQATQRLNLHEDEFNLPGPSCSKAD